MGAGTCMGRGSETAAQLFDSPAALKMVGAPFCFIQSQCLLSPAGSKSCLSCIPSCSLVLNVLVASASPSCQEKPTLWESLLPLRLMNLCPRLSLMKKAGFVIASFRVTVRLTCLLPC